EVSAILIRVTNCGNAPFINVNWPINVVGLCSTNIAIDSVLGMRLLISTCTIAPFSARSGAMISMCWLDLSFSIAKSLAALLNFVAANARLFQVAASALIGEINNAVTPPKKNLKKCLRCINSTYLMPTFHLPAGGAILLNAHLQSNVHKNYHL